MRLTVFGCDASWPSAGGACACTLVQAGGYKILLEMGSGALTKLQQRIDLAQLDLILVSHLHFDHMGDIFCAKYQLETRRAWGQAIGAIPLWTPPLPGVYHSQLAQGDVFELREIEPGGEVFPLPGLAIEFIPTRHTVEAYGMRLRLGNEVLAYSGDSGPCEALYRLAHGADAFLCEATMSVAEASQAEHHLAAGQAVDIARQAGVGRLLLTHTHPKDRAQLQALAAACKGQGGGPAVEVCLPMQEYDG